jgi:hypothetical protein
LLKQDISQIFVKGGVFQTALPMKKEYKASTSLSKTCEDFGTNPATAMKSLTNFQVFAYNIKRAICV